MKAQVDILLFGVVLTEQQRREPGYAGWLAKVGPVSLALAETDPRI